MARQGSDNVISALQMRLSPREQRLPALLPCHIRHGASAIPACIHNLSSHGLLVGSDGAPAPGTYVDIRRGRHVIIGRVVWRKGRIFGVRTQDRLDLAGLMAAPGDKAAPSGRSAASATARLASEGRLARQIEQSRRLATGLQFFVLTLVAIGAGLFVAISAYGMLAAPAEAIGNALDQG